MPSSRRILVVGNGGRENAVANALLLSADVELVGITPQNYGLIDPQTLCGETSRTALYDFAASDIPGIVALAQAERMDLVVIGPEAPLVSGLADVLRAAGIATVGPGAATAQLEGSKRYAKAFMQRHGVPTAAYAEFADAAALLAHVAACPLPVVLKADGLAAGKGVFVCNTREEALAAASALLVERRLGDAAQLVIAEEGLSGPEISFVCLVAGGRAEVLPPSSDYKRLLDGDAGPNTGGMGNICPTPHCDDDTLVEFVRDVLAPTVRGLQVDELDYRGFLFIGTMKTPHGLKVLEYNVRFGDPEAEVMLPLCDCDWPRVLLGIANGELPRADVTPGGHVDHPGTHGPIRLRDGAAIAVVLASRGYPESKGEPVKIEGLERVLAQGLLAPQPRADGRGWDPPAVQICHAGTSVGADHHVGLGEEDRDHARPLLATGGRVLCISARAENLSLARRLVYEVVGNIHFDGMQLRTDIGKLR